MISYTEGAGQGRRKRERALQFRFELARAEPAVWRRLLVRESMWLSRLHEAVQIAFEWYDYQTHRFTIGDVRYGNPVRGETGSVEDDRDYRLDDLGLSEGAAICYDYDFGEGWHVDLTLEKFVAIEEKQQYPWCLAGERAGPPEDCGGPEAFRDLVHALEYPDLESSKPWLDWLGADWRPENFDAARINKELRRIAK